MAEKGLDEQSLDEAYFDALDDYTEAEQRMRTISSQARPDFDPATLRLGSHGQWAFTDANGSSWIWQPLKSQWDAYGPDGLLQFDSIPWAGTSPEQIAREAGIVPGLDEPTGSVVPTALHSDLRGERVRQGLPEYGPAAPLTKPPLMHQLQGAEVDGRPEA